MSWKNFGKRISAFTLAEVLITLGIIGVIAAYTMPTLLLNVQYMVRKHSATIVARKFSESVEVMPADDDTGPFSNTAEFVDALKAHLKVTHICQASNIRDCWPYDKVKLYDDSEYNISNATTGNSAFKLGNKDPNGNEADYSSPTVAVEIVDGTTALISYNTKCSLADPKATENCFVALFEINGSAPPNALGQDVILLNALNFGNTAPPTRNLNRPDNVECTGSICHKTGDYNYAMFYFNYLRQA